MQLWTFLHILSMFAAVTIIVGSILWAVVAIRRRDLGALRAYFRIADRADQVGGLLFTAGVIFGLIAAVTIGFDLLQGWLVFAYVVVAASIIVGVATGPYLKRLKGALDATEGDEPGPELEAVIASPIPYAAAVISVALIAAVIWDMVFKPF